MNYRLEFELPGLPRTLNSRGHWRKGYHAAQKWIYDVAAAVGFNRPASPMARAILTLTRCSSIPMDHDNLVSGFKPIIDGLVRCGVLENDRWENIGMPHYGWEPAPAKKGKIRVIVEGCA